MVGEGSCVATGAAASGLRVSVRGGAVGGGKKFVAAGATTCEVGEGLFRLDEVGDEDPLILRAFNIARCCCDSATEISSFVSISVNRVSSSGAGLVVWIYP